MRRQYTKRTSEDEKQVLDFLRVRGKIIFSIDDVRQFHDFSRLILNLYRKGWIQRIEKGKYVLADADIDSFIIGTRVVTPSAIGYWSALNFYGLTEQFTNSVFVQTVKRKSSKEILNVPYRFVTVHPKKFFGHRKEYFGSQMYLISDIEKTIVDCFDLLQYAGGFVEAVKGFYNAYKQLDKAKLWQYAEKVNNVTVVKRIAFLSEFFEMSGFVQFHKKANRLLSNKYTVLDPFSPKKGTYLSRWKLLVNVSHDALRGIVQ